MRRITYALSLLFIFLVPWEDSISTSGWGSLARVAGLGLAALWLITVLTEGRFRKPHLFHFLVLLFVLWNLLSVFWSLDTAGTRQRLITYSQIFLLVLVFWDILQSPGELRAALQAYIFGAYVLVGGTFYNYLNGIVSVSWEGRYSAPGVNAVDMALILIIGLPIALHLFLLDGPGKLNRVLRWVNLAYLPFAAYAVLLTGSRTSLLAVIPFVIYVAVTSQISLRRRILIFAGLFVLLLALIPLVPQTLLGRLSTIGSSIAAEDLGGRVALWREAIAILARYPFLGTGAGTLDSVMGGAAHNTYISVATETGFAGLILFLSSIAVAAVQATRSPQKNAALWLAVFFTWAIGVLSLSWEVKKLTWIVLTFLVIAGSVEMAPAKEAAALPNPIESRPSSKRSRAAPQPKATAWKAQKPG